MRSRSRTCFHHFASLYANVLVDLIISLKLCLLCRTHWTTSRILLNETTMIFIITLKLCANSCMHNITYTQMITGWNDFSTKKWKNWITCNWSETPIFSAIWSPVSFTFKERTALMSYFIWLPYQRQVWSNYYWDRFSF